MNILIVSPAFPPFSGVGSLRMKNLAIFLRDKGENVTVLRNNPSFWGEKKLKSTVPEGIEIFDAKIFGDFNTCSDIYVGAIKKILDSKKIDLIIYSVGPFFTLKSAYDIYKSYEIDYVIDFRDLWIYERFGNINFVKKIKKIILSVVYRKVEKKAILYARKVIVVTPGDYNIMIKKYKKFKNKFFVIFNGFEKIKDNLDNRKKRNNIIALGKFSYYSLKNANVFLNGLKNFNLKNKMNIKLHHIGEKEKEIVDSSNNYFSLGFFNYEDAIEKIDNYIAGVIIYDHPTGYGTKVFDYISRNIPIILVTKKGEALSKFVNSFKNGFVCKNEREVENALNILIGNNIVLLDDCDKLYKYSRDFQNEKFYNVIKEGDFVERK